MKTIPNLLNELSDRVGSKTALVDRGTCQTYSQLRERSLTLGEGLRAQGIEKGDRVGLWMPNIIAYIEMFFACAEIGAIVVSVNTKFKSFELADIVSRSGCKMLVLWPDFKNIPFFEILSEVPADGLSHLESVVLYSEKESQKFTIPACLSNKNIVNFSDLYVQTELEKRNIDEQDGLVIFTTSGTTGKPKFVLHSHKSITVHAGEVADHFSYADKDCRMLQAIPLCGTFGLTQTLAGLASGAEVYCLPVFDPAQGAQLIIEHKITDMNGSDDMFAMLLDQSDDDIPYPSLKQAGFAAFNPALSDIVEHAEMRGIRLAGLWGMSELQALFARQEISMPADLRKRAGGVLVSTHAKVRITDPETGEKLAFGEQGEIEISAPSQMKEYFGNPEATRNTFTDDGYIKTGDLGYQEDERSFLFIARMGDVLRLGGFLTDPKEIENCLQEISGVSQAQVVGVETIKGVKAFAFITSDAQFEIIEDDVIAHCKARLAGYKLPIRAVIVNAFPMTESANGLKIQRSKLRDDAAKIWQQAL
ncbi:MAG: AMP-binding protein [Sneathiella sp.]